MRPVRRLGAAALHGVVPTEPGIGTAVHRARADEVLCFSTGTGGFEAAGEAVRVELLDVARCFVL